MIYKDKCRHFTGIQHETCGAGVVYLTVRDTSPPGPYRWPCLESFGVATTVCPQRSLLTQEELATEERELRAAVDKACADIEAGKCHVCGADAEPSRVVGRCKYTACGHRIGQVLTEEDEP